MNNFAHTLRALQSLVTDYEILRNTLDSTVQGFVGTDPPAPSPSPTAIVEGKMEPLPSNGVDKLSTILASLQAIKCDMSARLSQLEDQFSPQSEQTQTAGDITFVKDLGLILK